MMTTNSFLSKNLADNTNDRLINSFAIYTHEGRLYPDLTVSVSHDLHK